MRKFLLIALLTACTSLIGIGQLQLPLREVDLTVNGVRADSSMKEVNKLGKPTKVTKLGYDECGGGYRRVLYLSGLEVGVLGNRSTTKANVISLTITSSKWRIAPGVRIGATRATLIRLFGRPVTSYPDRLEYVTKENLGGVTFHLRKGKLYRVEMMQTLC